MGNLFLFVFIGIFLTLGFLTWYSGFFGKIVFIAGIFVCIFVAFIASNYVHAATLEERVALYRQLYFGPEISRCIFIGDSRTVGMQMSVQSDDIWSCKESMGYDWMVSEGIPAIDGQVTEDTAVFILLGINDLGNSQAYADYINSKAAKWEGKTYFVSIGPVGNTTVTNAQIEAFNSVIKDNAEFYEYLDLYGNMTKDGFGTWDGLHYTSGTYQYIYNFLKDAT